MNESVSSPYIPVPSIGIYPPMAVARVGNSPDKFYIGPETYRGLPTNPDGSNWTDADLRDVDGRMARQAAKFQLFDNSDVDNPVPLTIGSKVSGKVVKDIYWVVHLANKKSSWYEFATSEGENGYSPTHALRNESITDPADRLAKLVIDGGPRQINGSCSSGVNFSLDKNGLVFDYAHLNFPAGSQVHPGGLQPTGESIDTLGELRTQQDCSLLVLGGLGISGTTEDSATIQQYANNDNWFDDTADGPVWAWLLFEDGSQSEWITGGYVMVTPPSYAPEIANLVTLFDTIFDAQVRAGQHPEICRDGIWQAGPDGYKPNFDNEIRPLIERGTLYPWVAAIPSKPHEFDMDQLCAPGDEYNGLRNYVLQVLRGPNMENQIIGSNGATMMPYLAGDNCLKPDHMPSNYLRITDTQYFYLQQWAQGNFDTSEAKVKITDGISRGVLENCVGGAFSPGIEMTWISRNIDIYSSPFRINGILSAVPNAPPLSLGFNPKRIEAGDICRYMAVPWQADFNECSSQPIDGRILWWWPAQRPEFIYEMPVNKAADAEGIAIPEAPGLDDGPQVAWIGQGFDQNGNDFISFSNDVDMVKYWSKLGFVIEKEVPVSGGTTDCRFVEVQRTLGPRPFYPQSE